MQCCSCCGWRTKDQTIPPCTKTVKQYELLSCIGEGSYGRVHLALWKHYDMERGYFKWKISAIKSVSKRRVVEKGHHLKIDHERQALQRLGSTSPFIVDLIGSYQSVDHLFFVLEFCSGGNLGELLRRNCEGRGGFSENTVRFYLSQVLCALNHIHEHGVIYRDLKPDNIVLDGRGHIRLVDFGLSHVAKFNIPSDDGRSIYFTGRAFTICGSDEYIAPEVLLKLDVGYDWSCDIWSFGCILFELLLGYPAYEAPTRPERFLKITTQDGYLAGSNFNHNQSINNHLKTYQNIRRDRDDLKANTSSVRNNNKGGIFPCFSNFFSSNENEDDADQVSTMVAFDELSSDSKDFISKLLTVDLRKRIGTYFDSWEELNQQQEEELNGVSRKHSKETSSTLHTSTGIRKSSKVTMKRIQEERLRLSHGIQELRNHSFWKNEIQSWDPHHLINRRPPHVPFPKANAENAEGDMELKQSNHFSFLDDRDQTLIDTRYFSDRFTNQIPRLPPLGHPHKGGPTPMFEDFHQMPTEDSSEEF